MRSDALIAFVPIGSPLSLVAGAGTSIASTNTIDLLGNGVGQAPTNTIGNVTLFGTDMGVGANRPELNVIIGTALATANSCTLNVALQAAADLGSGGSYQPDTWHTVDESGPLTAAQCTANTIIFRSPFLPVFPANLRPRFMRLYFQVPAAENFSAGTILSAIVTTARDDQANRYAANNYVVA